MEIDLKKLEREDLLKLKRDIENQLEFIDNFKNEIQLSKEKTTLLDLKNDKIFCISFSGSKIHNVDYVKINFNKNKDKNWTNFSTEHNTKPMGCSSSVEDECMNNHCFLSEFSSNSFYFFTLKPENWKIDLKLEIERSVKLKKKYFNEDIKKFKRNMNTLIKNNDVDNLINDYK